MWMNTWHLNSVFLSLSLSIRLNRSHTTRVEGTRQVYYSPYWLLVIIVKYLTIILILHDHSCDRQTLLLFVNRVYIITTTIPYKWRIVSGIFRSWFRFTGARNHKTTFILYIIFYSYINFYFLLFYFKNVIFRLQYELLLPICWLCMTRAWRDTSLITRRETRCFEICLMDVAYSSIAKYTHGPV